MKTRLFFSLIVSTMIASPCAQANPLKTIALILLKTYGIQTKILDEQSQMLGVQKDILTSQRDINNLMKQVNSNLTGHYGWGSYQTHDYQSYGGSASDWSNVMRMADVGHGDGALGQTINQVANQFPADRSAYNRGVSDVRSQQYYALKSQTVLAVRAASQLDYNKIQQQIAYQQMLQQQIEKTNDLKAAVDLSSRIQVEGNLINLEILRQATLTNQQQAITDQSTVNAALANAKFLTK